MAKAACYSSKPKLYGHQQQSVRWLNENTWHYEEAELVVLGKTAPSAKRRLSIMSPYRLRKDRKPESYRGNKAGH